jgi:hypothetical protein
LYPLSSGNFVRKDEKLDLETFILSPALQGL